MLKVTLKVLIYFFVFPIALLILYFIIAVALSLIEKKPEKQCGDISIYLLTNGVHTDLVLPVKIDNIDWSKKVKYSDTKSKDSVMQFLAFGWGDKEFYINTPTWADLKFNTAFQAVFGLGSAAMHTTYYKNIEISENCIELKISKENYKKLAYYIENSFVFSEKGEFVNIKTEAAYGENDSFYEAQGRFSLFYTCNTWTNNGLKFCGQKACLWTPFDKGIFYHYRN